MKIKMIQLSKLTDEEQIKAVEKGEKPIAMTPEYCNIKSTLPFILIPSGEIHFNDDRKITKIILFNDIVYYNPKFLINALKVAEFYSQKNYIYYTLKLNDIVPNIEITNADHIMLGKLFGYTDEEINIFIKSLKINQLEIVKGYDELYTIYITENGFQWNIILTKLTLSKAIKCKDFFVEELRYIWNQPEDKNYLK